MKRYTLTQGATTSAGGKVIAASSHGSINGVGLRQQHACGHWRWRGLYV